MVQIDDAQRLLGHSKPSTTLDLYTYYQHTLDPRVGDLFADFSPTQAENENSDDGPGKAKDAV